MTTTELPPESNEPVASHEEDLRKTIEGDANFLSGRIIDMISSKRITLGEMSSDEPFEVFDDKGDFAERMKGALEKAIISHLAIDSSRESYRPPFVVKLDNRSEMRDELYRLVDAKGGMHEAQVNQSSNEKYGDLAVILQAYTEAMAGSEQFKKGIDELARLLPAQLVIGLDRTTREVSAMNLHNREDVEVLRRGDTGSEYDKNPYRKESRDAS